MHEYQLTKSIIEIAEKHAGGSPVRSVSLVIGEISGVSGDAIKLYFEEISQGSACEGAEIILETVKPMLKCPVCGSLFARKPGSFSCDGQGCPGEGLPTDIGREFYVKCIEIERDDG